MKKNSNTCCDFCAEFSGNSNSVFNHIYKGNLDSRVVYSTDNFLAIPTIGQFVDNYLLLLPLKHYESLSELTITELLELSDTLNYLKSYLSQFGDVIIFEHGAKNQSGGGCGVYHAHMHIIPLIKSVDIFSFFKHKLTFFDSLIEAYKYLKKAQEYILAVNVNNTICVVDLSNRHGLYSSQFMRKKLCNSLNIKLPWDWRKYNFPENGLISIAKNYSL